MMAWSVVPDQAHLSQDGIRKIKSTLTNQIFQQEMLHIYEQKSVSRDELVRQARDTMRELCREMRQGIQSHPVVEVMMEELSMELGEVTGKKSYGYLPNKLKKQVDQIVDEMEKLPAVSRCYDKWLDLQWQVESYYRDKPRERKPLSEQKEFRSIKNAVIRQAEQIRLGTVTFEEKGIRQWERDSVDDRWASDRYWELKNWIEDDTAELEDRDYAIQEMDGLAEDGDVGAQYYMGQLYRDGPLLIPDAVNAFYWFNRAAKQGSVSAQYDLGKLLLSDDGEVRNVEEGIRWLEQAADRGHSFAAYRLGKEYLKGKNVERDPTKAVSYFTRSAEAGNPYAQYMLGKLCLMGQGMKQSTEQALVWFQMAADQGHQHAQYFLNRQDDLKPPSVMLSVTQLLYHMSRIFENTTPVEDSTTTVPHIDRKRMRELMEKRIAAGHKPDDHVDERQYIGPTMSTLW